jgi:CRISPR-associated endonuclease Csn1
MKNILGLDLGTNSIGWALVEQDFSNKQGEILGMGSRIIPMSQDVMDNFGGGKPTETQTSARTNYRGVRRLRERFLLRRERLHRVLNVLNFLPDHYASQIDFKKKLGKFKENTEPKLVFLNKDFIFKKSFEEMLLDFKKHQPFVLKNEKGEEKLIPYDWTIYYLRKKALSQKIEKEELAWILLNFNQKRGYYQLRGEEDEDATRTAQTRIYFDTQVIDEIIDTGSIYKELKVIQIKLSNGETGKYFSKELPNWVGEKKNIIVTVDLDKEGNDRLEEDGTIKRRFSIPSEDDWDKKWKLVKIKTEKEIKDSKKTVGAYIYDALLQNPKQKIKGKLVRTIERKFYKSELKQILDKQKEFHTELQDDDLYNDCVRELYRNNEAHQLTLSKKDFVHLFLDDIIFYQRPLRSQKSSISDCPLEFREFKKMKLDEKGNKIKDENGKYLYEKDENNKDLKFKTFLKAIPKSNPYYQEFRIWQWMYNLNIYKKENDENVTTGFLNSIADFKNLFEFLNTRKEVEQKPLLKFLLEQKDFKGKLLNAEVEKYRWNYVEDKKYPCNETKTLITTRLAKVENIAEDFLTKEMEQKLWHIIYSVNDKIEFETALKSFARKNNLDVDSFFEAFRKAIIRENTYGSFSEKAIKKLLPLLRLGKYWNWENIDTYSQNRILNIINGEYDVNIKDKVREKAIHLTKEDDFQGLQLWLAQYVVYGRHSEASMIGKWNSSDDLEEFLKEFKQHSLRNPIVEQVITETLRVVKDIWLKYGNGAKDFFNEIHIELGREMKQTKDERSDATKRITENENTNLRIKALLAEMMNDGNVESVRPYSPMQQEILKIYEDGILNSDIEIADDILKISKTAQPSSSDLKRYKLWLEQGYKSPYTGQIIPLNKLFTSEYEIEHIIPQSRYFDDSFSNKIICESAVNKLKDNYIGLAFIKQFHGSIVECGFGKKVKVFEVEQYEDFIKKHYAKNRSKRNKLFLEEIPEKMIERQMNDTRYISKFISGVLSNIVRAEDGSDEGVNSKNIIPGNGKITTTLKQDWGLNDAWNELILPRFERMNQLTRSTDFTSWNENHQKFLPTIPIEYSKGFSKKRIDHRHHAMDALVVACATREHVNLLNNQSAKSDTKRYDLKKKLMKFEKVIYNHPHTKERIEREVAKQFLKPWETFTIDAKNSLETIVVSFKQNLRVINKATNYHDKYIDKDGVKVKTKVEQIGTNWAIRKSLHEETVSGKINLPWVEKSSEEFITATRKALDTSFNIDKINKITDTGIQKILKNYLKTKNNDSEIAFSPEGVDELNKNIRDYNDDKPHQPIFKVRIYEKGKGRFALGQTGNKIKKYVQGAPNLFYAIYKDKDNKKSYETIPLDLAIERLKQILNPVPETNKNGSTLHQILSPLDLVYIPTDEEIELPELVNFTKIKKAQIERLYNTNDFSGYTIYFSQNSFAKNIYPKEMDMTWNEKKQKASGSFDSKTASFNKKPIKDIFIKLKVDRLGNISKA